MRKTVFLSIVLGTGLFVLAFLFYQDRHKASFFMDENNLLCIRIKYDTGYHKISPWYDEEENIWYYFLPGNIHDDKIWCSGIADYDLYVEGAACRKYMNYSSGSLYHIRFAGESYEIVFLQTTNIPSLFIDTDTGSMDYIHEDKDHEESGHVLCIDDEGHIFYDGGAEKISGRGNATWSHDKKPYHLKLSSSGALAGLTAGKEWNLLAFYYDGDKIHTKLGLDISQILGSPCTAESTWVNLYTNGEYRGLYLLTQSPNGLEPFHKKQDTILLEKELEERCEDTPHFITENGNPFVIVRPKNPGEKELNHIAEWIQNVEDGINQQNFQEVIDINSFAALFLTEEISLNYDAFRSSSYVYKPSGEEKLYAGPAWDYDAAFGEYLLMGAEWTNPDGTVLVHADNQLDWYELLYENKEFYGQMTKLFEEKLPELKVLFTDGIDSYASLISDSVANDDIRWKWSAGTFQRAGTYQTWENDIRYLQYFCLNRLKALSSRWSILPETDINWFGDGTTHRVRFYAHGECVFDLTVKDGDVIPIHEMEDFQDYRGGSWVYSYSAETFNQYLPVLEDCEIVFQQ